MVNLCLRIFFLEVNRLSLNLGSDGCKETDVERPGEENKSHDSVETIDSTMFKQDISDVSMEGTSIVSISGIPIVEKVVLKNTSEQMF